MAEMDYMGMLRWLMQAIQQQGRQPGAGPMGYPDPAGAQQRQRQRPAGNQGFEDRGAMQDRLRRNRAAPGAPRRPMYWEQGTPRWSAGGAMGGWGKTVQDMQAWDRPLDRTGEQERLRRMSDEASGRVPAPPVRPMYGDSGMPPAPVQPMYMDPGYGGWSTPFMGGGSSGMAPSVSSLDPSGEHQRLLAMSNAGPLPPPPPPSGQDWVNPSAFAGWQPPAKTNTDWSGVGGWSVSEDLGGYGGGLGGSGGWGGELGGGSVSRDLEPWKPLENTV
jgi:hypothetical protein